MAEYNMPKFVDHRTWVEVFEGFSPEQRRWAFLAVKMAEKGITFQDIGEAAGISGQAVSVAFQGEGTMSPRVYQAATKVLDVDLDPFMSVAEMIKIRVSAAVKKERKKTRRGEKR